MNKRLEEFAARIKPIDDIPRKDRVKPYTVPSASKPVLMRATEPNAPDAEVALEYQGMPLDVSFVPRGSTAIGWRNGRLFLEYHPDLKVYGLGTNTSNSQFWQLSFMPPVQELLQVVINTLKPSPWRLEEPQLPAMYADDEQAQQAQQMLWVWAQYTWSQWTRQGATYNLRDVIEDCLTSALTMGYYLGEGGAYTVEVPGVGQVKVPILPQYRAPFSIREWVCVGDQVAAAVQYDTDSDSYGRTGGGDGNVRTAIPLAQSMHVRHRPTGPSDPEGRPIHRPAYMPLKVMQIIIQMSGLTVEADGVHTRFLSQDKDRPMTRGTDGQPGELDLAEAHLESYAGEGLPYMIGAPGTMLHAVSGLLADLTPQYQLAEKMALSAMGGADKLIAQYGAGSRAAKSEGEKSSRDQLDFFATMVSDGLAQYLDKWARQVFPEVEKYGLCVGVTYAQVEERDNMAYLEGIEKYLEIRDRLPSAMQSKLDEMLDFDAADSAESEAQKAEKEQADEPHQDHQPDSAQLAAQDSYIPPKGVQEAAQRGLDLRREFGRGGTEVGIQRARNLSNGDGISYEVIKKMVSFFARHEKNRGTWEGDETSNGYIAWMLWGGDAGRAWAQTIVDRVEEE